MLPVKLYLAVLCSTESLKLLLLNMLFSFVYNNRDTERKNNPDYSAAVILLHVQSVLMVTALVPKSDICHNKFCYVFRDFWYSIFHHIKPHIGLSVR